VESVAASLSGGILSLESVVLAREFDELATESSALLDNNLAYNLDTRTSVFATVSLVVTTMLTSVSLGVLLVVSAVLASVSLVVTSLGYVTLSLLDQLPDLSVVLLDT